MAVHARETRVNLDLRSHGGPHPVRAFIEGDFFGDNNAFRLRHGFGEYGDHRTHSWGRVS